MARKNWFKRNITHKNVRNYARTGASVAATAALALKTALIAKSLINAEVKYNDVSFANTAINSAGTQQLIQCVQGSDVQNRTGNSIKVKSIYIRYTTFINSAAPTVPCSLRCVVVHDRNPNGTLPNFTDVFTVADINAPKKLESGRRFKILYDKVHNYQPNGSVEYHYDVYRKLNMEQTEFYSSASTTAAQSTNTLWFFYISNVGVNGPILGFQSRIRFLDN